MSAYCKQYQREKQLSYRISAEVTYFLQMKQLSKEELVKEGQGKIDQYHKIVNMSGCDKLIRSDLSAQLLACKVRLVVDNS
mmetsp:Transcript_39751/g.45282  ORF Transcript_39751/g.45282 Transcript_39751/m.45282 type:complete len:81 (-) Transcript_39751:273-515(-)